MADDAKPKPAGKTFSFNLTGDDLRLYEQARDLYQGDIADEDATVAAALAGLPVEARLLVEARMASAPKAKELSHRQVFVRALQDSLSLHEEADVKAELPESGLDEE